MGLRRNKKLKTRLAGSQPVTRAPSLGPGPPGACLFPTKNHSQITIFANLVGAWRRRGCRLKRLLRRWGPGGKRSRDTPPTPPTPPHLSPHFGCKGERKRVFTLSAFGNHPTRPQGRRIKGLYWEPQRGKPKNIVGR